MYNPKRLHKRKSGGSTPCWGSFPRQRIAALSLVRAITPTGKLAPTLVSVANNVIPASNRDTYGAKWGCRRSV